MTKSSTPSGATGRVSNSAARSAAGSGNTTTRGSTPAPGRRAAVVAFALRFGHWATGSSDLTIDGKLVKGDPRRATGVHANAAMRVDDHFKNTCMVDLIGGSVSFYDTRVKLVKA
jgi:hypothetical protein